MKQPRSLHIRHACDEIATLSLAMTKWVIFKQITMKQITQKAKSKQPDRKVRLSKLFGAIKLKEDAVVLQRRWRDEWN
ncbi:MAG: hypothetical protein JWQ54_3234 [Mucilaginibacter sp.]|nr:hypothetical protein [Mucilaginibacter sp.]